MKSAKDEYPELYALACNIAKDTLTRINAEAPKIKSEARYNAQCVLELLITELEKSV